MPTSKVIRDAQIDQDLARELYAVESDPNYKPFAQDVGQALQTIKNSGVRIVPAASGHRPTWVAAIRACRRYVCHQTGANARVRSPLGVRLPPKVRKRPPAKARVAPPMRLR
jgi:hypothetical protein